MVVIYCDWDGSYAQLPRLLLTFLQTEPNTRVCMIKSLPDVETCAFELERLFFTFGHSLQGFYHCRPVLSIDTTQLYGRHKGKLLAALGVDGNGQLFPVGFGILREEILKIGTHFKNATLKNMVYRIGSEIEMRHFDSGMTELAILNPRGHNWLMNIPEEQWSLAYDEGYRYECMTINLVECFNEVLLSRRNLPICAMIRLIHRKLVNYFVEKWNNLKGMLTEKPHGFTDRGVDLLEVSRRHSQYLYVTQVYDRGLGQAEVVSSLRNTQHVDLSRAQCGCGAWIQYKVSRGHVVKAYIA